MFFFISLYRALLFRKLIKSKNGHDPAALLNPLLMIKAFCLIKNIIYKNRWMS